MLYFSTAIHSHMLIFMRFDEGLDINLNLDLWEILQKTMGINNSSDEQTICYPMVALSTKLL